MTRAMDRQYVSCMVHFDNIPRRQESVERHGQVRMTPEQLRNACEHQKSGETVKKIKNLNNINICF